MAGLTGRVSAITRNARIQPDGTTYKILGASDQYGTLPQWGSFLNDTWRPKPTDMVCDAFDESRVRRIVTENLAAFKASDCRVHIRLKDIGTVQGDPSRLGKWVRLVRQIADSY